MTLPSLSYFDNGVLVSGSGGFLGTHLCVALSKTSRGETVNADVRKTSELTPLAARWNAAVVVHLAARGTVLAPLQGVPEMLDVSADGLVHLLDAFAPRMAILASSCAVYGDTGKHPASPDAALNPLSVYGLSKVICERVLERWVEEHKTAAVIFRIGNLVGLEGHGLIDYLLRHALRHPCGERPAEMRGGGQMLRDYVPVDYAARVFRAAIDRDWKPGEAHVLNLGSGVARTNGEVAALVQQTLSEHGITLRIRYDDRPSTGEPVSAVLDTRSTEIALGIAPPTDEAVTTAIRNAVLVRLERAQEAKTVSA